MGLGRPYPAFCMSKATLQVLEYEVHKNEYYEPNLVAGPASIFGIPIYIEAMPPNKIMRVPSQHAHFRLKMAIEVALANGGGWEEIEKQLGIDESAV